MQNRTITLMCSLGLALLFVCNTAAAQYELTNLVSNQAGVAKHDDPLIVNAWGLVHGPGTPWWVSDNMSGWSTLYNANGVKQGLVVEIPTATGAGVGSPTGVVFNGSQDFKVNGQSTFFIFATLDGTISAWAPNIDLNNALIQVKKAGAVYTGLAITNNASGNLLFAADNANNKVDVYNGSFQHIKSFTDTTLPTGFAPFGIRDLAGLIYVTFASTSGGPGGFIDVFSEKGVFLKQLVHGAPLNQPWGLAAAPGNFGPLSNTLLVSNNTNTGTINGFNSITGQFVGTIKDTTGKAIQIDQLWAVGFGDGSANNGPKNTLFFTAGPDNNFAGVLGSIVFK